MSEEQIRQIIRDELNQVLGFSSRIPLSIDQALRERLGDTTQVTGTGTVSTTNIVLSGSPPYNFDVLTSSGTVLIEINGVVYELLKK